MHVCKCAHHIPLPVSVQMTPGGLFPKLTPSLRSHDTTEWVPLGCAIGLCAEGRRETERRGDEEEIRRWERQPMRDRQAGEIRSGE